MQRQERVNVLLDIMEQCMMNGVFLWYCSIIVWRYCCTPFNTIVYLMYWYFNYYGPVHHESLTVRTCHMQSKQRLGIFV